MRNRRFQKGRRFKKRVKKVDTMANLLSRLLGVNGRISFATKRYENLEGAYESVLLVFIEIPITKSKERVEKYIKEHKLDERPIVKGRVNLVDSDIEGIKILKGITYIPSSSRRKTEKILYLFNLLVRDVMGLRRDGNE